MRSNKIKVFVVILVFVSFLHGGDSYRYIDIGECVLPIEKKLVLLKNTKTYTEKDYNGSLYRNPIEVTIEKIKNNNTIDLVKKILNLEKKVTLESFTAFTDGRKTNTNTLVFLKKHTMLTSNIAFEELRFMLKHCKETSTEN